MYKTMLIFIAAVAYADAYSSCNVHPKFWCDSKEIAKDCGVLPQCAEWNWVDKDARPVFISVYMESLCPDTIKFITTVLYPTWLDLFPAGIMRTAFFPYGNAKETKNADGTWNFTCQHGPDECTGNLIENCMMKFAMYNESIIMPVMNCIESSRYPLNMAESCIATAGLPWSDILKCSKSREGNLLMHESGLNTESLKPAHTFIPWILVNGISSKEIEKEAISNLGWLVCQTYRGKKPKACDKYINKDIKMINFK